MEKKHFAGLIAVIGVLVAGCDHSTNSEEPPAGSGVAIVAPTQNAYVDGTVDIAVSATGIAPEMVKFYVDGNLVGTKTSAPWTCSWDASSHASNSVHTLKAYAYNEANAYMATADVTVRVK